ncbi:MAG: SDR family NAD(P)-dependent oxidoreductase [Pseudomonadota bacterium]
MAERLPRSYSSGVIRSASAHAIPENWRWERSRVLTARFEATDKRTHRAWVDATIERFGRIDGLINSAGVSGRISIGDEDDDAIDQVWQVNVKAPLSMTRLSGSESDALG